ncbi:MAG: DUF6057 family protein [Bacteroidales bacterium]|nr:DUF6057 family protein [Bacteroidales bacterium]
MVSLIFAILVWLFFAFCYSGHLVYNQGLWLFLDTKEYFIEKVSHIGGLGDYIAIFLTQFNYWPLLGAAIVAVLLGGIHFLLTLSLEKSGFKTFRSGFALAVSFALWMLLCRKGASVSLVTGILIATALSLVRSENRALFIPWTIVVAVAMYFGFGLFPTLTFAVLSVLTFIPAPKWEAHSKKILEYSLVAVIFAAGLFGVFKFADINMDMDMRYTQAARNREWTKLIKYSQNRRLKKSAAMCNCVNLALANTKGQDGKSLLTSFALYGEEFGTGSLMLSEQQDQINACEILFNLGFISEARRCAFERLTSVSEDGYCGYWISRLAECALIDGRMELARRYLSILSHNFIYAYSARKLMEMSEEDISNHFLYGKLKEMRMDENVSFQNRGLDFMLLAMLHDHKDNQMAMDYYIAFANISNNE